MSPADEPAAKVAAAEHAARMVGPGMNVGLGTGSTASLVIHALGDRMRREGLKIRGVATSVHSAELAEACGIPLLSLDEVPGALDITIDGADEVDPAFRMIKGRGGALLREKIVAAASHRRVIVVTPDKLVDRLGQSSPVPVEVSAFGIKHTEHALRNLGATTRLRLADGKPYTTDEGHRILDCRFLAIEDPEELNARLNGLVGVFETGLFVGLCDQLVVGHPDGVQVRERPATRFT
jgi:ribose 5-phosphate isomerase A